MLIAYFFVVVAFAAAVYFVEMVDELVLAQELCCGVVAVAVAVESRGWRRGTPASAGRAAPGSAG